MPSFRALPPTLRSTGRTRPIGPDAARIHIPVARAMVDCGVYCDGSRLPGKYTHAAALSKVRELEEEGKEAFVWVGLHEPDEHQMQAVADVFGLHELAVEDAVHAHQRPKLERYDDTLFLVLKTVNYVEHESVANAREIVETGEIMIFVGPDFVVTVRHGEHSGLASVRKHLDASPASLKLGPYAVMHAIADHVVDSYLDVTISIETDIDAMEEDIFSPMMQHQHRVHLSAQAGSRRTTPCGQPTDAGTAAHRHRLQRPDLGGGPAVHARRPRPQHPGVRPNHQLRRNAQLTGAGRGGQSGDAAEHRHAQDLGLRRHRGGADCDSRHLWDELRAHAGTARRCGATRRC